MTQLLAALRNAKRVYPGRAALEIESLEIFEGDSIALHGQNGSGKSTLLRVLCGITPLSSGTFEKTSRWKRSRISYCPQVGGIHGDLTLSENISLMRRRVPLTTTPDLYKQFMDEVDFSEARDVEVRRLSGGYQKLAMLIVALAVSADILVLDEPTADLHPSNVEKVASTLSRASKLYAAIVVADHSKEVLEFAQKKIELT